jgi:hypothetical protein
MVRERTDAFVPICFTAEMSRLKDAIPQEELIPIGPKLHLVTCPYCEKQSVHPWPGAVILFSSKQCDHCTRTFVIALNQSRA